MENDVDGEESDSPITETHDGRRLGIIGNIKRQFQERRAKREKETPTDRASRKTATATVWIAIFTVVLAFVGLGTLWEIIEGGRDTRDLADAAETQAEKMKDMSEAADKIRQAAQDMVVQEQRVADNAQKAMEASNRQSKAALDASIRASQLDQRAWVVVKNIESKPELGKEWIVNVHFTNTGKTPARDVRLSCTASPVKAEAVTGVFAPAVIPPNDDSFCQLHPLTSGVYDEKAKEVLSTQKEILYVLGHVVYRDVFGRSHWLTFCRVMQPDGAAWDTCQEHNDTGDGDHPPN